MFRIKRITISSFKHTEKSMLLYLYRPSKLQKDFSKKPVEKILKEHGYENTHFPCCIVKLIKKMKEKGEIPHEVGLFLGYPPEDVEGFIENKACNCKCVGCQKKWQVKF
mgnify:FL=1